MSYVQYTLHAKNKLGYGEEEILKKWNEYKNNEDILRDQLGPQNSKLRLYIPKGDYIIREDISGNAKQRELSTKARRATDQEMEAADCQMQEDLPRWSDDQFRTGSVSGAARNHQLFPSSVKKTAFSISRQLHQQASQGPSWRRRQRRTLASTNQRTQRRQSLSTAS